MWQKTTFIAVYKLTASFPKHELYGLASQMRRAAVSIAANIAEGFRKRGKADKARFMNTAEGSVDESHYYLILARDLRYSKPNSSLANYEVSRLLNSSLPSSLLLLLLRLSMQFFRNHILSIILFIPLVGMIPLFLIPKGNKQAARWWGNVVLFADFLASLPLVFWFSRETPGEQFKFIELHDWIPSIGAQYHLGIDGISFLLIMLTTVLGFLAVLSSWTAIQERVKEYYAMFLLLQAGMLGVFMSLDFFLFYVFWEVMLVPMYFIIGVWGGPRKLYAAIKFFLYTLAGSVLMLLGILTLYLNYTLPDGRHTFDLIELMKHSNAWPCRCRSGFLSPSRSASPSRCRCSPSTPGCRTLTWKHPPRVP